MHMYACNASMQKQAFCNNDGDFLVLPQIGRLDIKTELGSLMVRPGELVVLPAGIRWTVSLPDGKARGYIHEVFGSHFELPDLGIIGSNGLAAPRDFEYPVAAFDMDKSKWEGKINSKGNLNVGALVANDRVLSSRIQVNWKAFRVQAESHAFRCCGLARQLFTLQVCHGEVYPFELRNKGAA